jgi:hypothetical protein
MTNAIKQNLELLDTLQVHRLQSKADVQEELTYQGNTIRTDMQIQGSKIFSDATWKKRRSLNTQENLRTGIGLYCQLLRQNREETIMIQASTAQPSSPLLAETAALLLASKIASQLQAQGVTFLTDNLILAKAAATSSVTNEQVPWELRQQIADYKRASEQLFPKIYHIKRSLNGVAHDCAKQALRRPQSLPIFSCLNSAHRSVGICLVALSLQNIDLQGFVLLDVLCI